MITNFGDYSVKNVKTFRGRDGDGYNANLYRGKKKIAFIIDEGNGGEIHIDWMPDQTPHDTNNEKWKIWRELKNAEIHLLETHMANLPLCENSIDHSSYPVDAFIFIEDCVNKFYMDKDIKKMKKMCLTKTLFRHSNNRRGEYITRDAEYDSRIKAELKNRYGNDIEIFNEVLERNEIPSVFVV